MACVLADLGNSRLKWGLLHNDELTDVVSVPLDPDAWRDAWKPGMDQFNWVISTVNPPVAAQLGTYLKKQGVTRFTWYRSAIEVPVEHRLTHPETTGVDRALMVAEAIATHPRSAGLVVSCGTAITIERITDDSVWSGGAIAAGLNLTARALHSQTAQLPLVHPGQAPASFGSHTETAMNAGIFWGTVGAINELAHRQADQLGPAPWLILTGGDAPLLKPFIRWTGKVEVIDHLVLLGLRRIS